MDKMLAQPIALAVDNCEQGNCQSATKIWLDGKVMASRRVIWHQVGFVGLVLALGFGLQLVVWQLVLLAAAAAALLFSVHALPSLTHVVAPIDARGQWQWQVQTLRGSQLWRGFVQKLEVQSDCVILHCYVNEPLPQSARFVVFCDAMVADDYRKLRTIARFY